MKKGYLILIVILFVISLIVYFDDTLNNEKGKVCYEENCFDVEIVDSDIDRAEGLMFRESLCDDCGMLFIFDENGRYPFWMKNTLIYLDIIWIDENKEIVFITEKAEPCENEVCFSYDPGVDSRYVFEINGGRADEIGLGVGDRIEF